MILNLVEVLKTKKQPKIRKFKPIKTSRRTELWYQNELVRFVKAMHAEVMQEFSKEAVKNDRFSFSDDGQTALKTQLAKTIERIIEKKIDAMAKRISQGFIERANQQNQQETATRIKQATGVDVMDFLKSSPSIKEKLEVATLANIQLIKSIESQYLDKVQTAVTQSALSGGMVKDLAEKIKEIGNVTENRAKFIARDQTAKLNSALTQVRHQELGITHYRWSTSGDERVRDSHADKDGKIFAYAEPPTDTGHPGEDYNCRCIAVPVFDGEVKQEVERNQDVEQKTEKVLPKDFTEVINIGKSISDNYQSVIDKAIAEGQPYEGIMEIMRREGVELGGQVKISSLEKRALLEMTAMAKRYPKNWVEMANTTSDLVIKEYKARAFQMQVPANWDLERMKTGKVKWGRYKPLESSIKKGLLKNGDTFILSNTNHDESMRLSRFIHEYGHKLQRELPGLDKYFADLWKRRTEGKPYINYNGERIKDGGFPHPYYGRDYGNEKEPKPMEMLAMTFEALLGNDPDNTLENLRKKDPELFNLGLALLTRYKP